MLRAKPIRIIGDPDNQRSVKRSFAVIGIFRLQIKIGLTKCDIQCIFFQVTRRTWKRIWLPFRHETKLAFTECAWNYSATRWTLRKCASFCLNVRPSFLPTICLRLFLVSTLFSKIIFLIQTEDFQQNLWQFIFSSVKVKVKVNLKFTLTTDHED